MNIVIKKINEGIDEYLLTEKDKTILKVRHRRDLHTARVETVNERRVLIIENEGLIKIRMAIKNEYGVEIGQMFFDNFSDNQGVVQIDNIRYRFTINKKSSQELYIYKGSHRDLIFRCNLAFETEIQPDSKDQAAAFIISIVWYLHLLSVRETRSELVS
jgi:hypothetical protein